MRIYKIASLSMYVDGFQPQYQQFKDLLSLSFLITNKLFTEIMTQYDKNYYKEFYTGGDTITPDGTDNFKTTGVMNFYLNGIDPNRAPILTQEIIKILNDYGCTTGPTKLDKSNLFKDTQVIRIPILTNPRAGKANQEDIPPEINLANNNMHFIMNKVLNYNLDLWEGHPFNAEDMKKRIKYYLGETKLPEGEKAGQPWISKISPESPEEMKDFFSPDNADFLSGRSAISNYTENDVRSTLLDMLYFCDWALSHGFKEVSMA